MLSRDFFHVVKDEQTPVAHCSADEPPAVVVVVEPPAPPPQAAAQSTSTATATPQRTGDDPIRIRTSDRPPAASARAPTPLRRTGALACCTVLAALALTISLAVAPKPHIIWKPIPYGPSRKAEMAR